MTATPVGRTAPALLVLAALLIPSASAAAPTPARSQRVSAPAPDAEADGESARGSMGDGGRFVVFESNAANLVPGDTNEAFDIFVRDLELGTIERVSVGLDGAEADDDSYAAFMTPDARVVGFVSKASNLVPGDETRCIEAVTAQDISCPDIFLVDRTTGVLERISISNLEEEANDESHNGVAITPDGRFLAFWSDATNLVPGDTNARGDIFVRDRIAGTTERVSVGSGGVQSDGNSSEPSISADGRYVAFRSYASNLAGLDPDGTQFSDIYVHDRITDQTEAVSISSDGDDGIVNSYNPAISADARFVAYDSEASNLVPADTNGFGYGVYVYDRTTGRTEQVSVDSNGIQADRDSHKPSITPDGRYVTFVSDATNLAPNDSGVCARPQFQGIPLGEVPCRDMFVHDRLTGQTDRLSVPAGGQQMNGQVWDNDVTADGRSVIFESASSTLVAGDTNRAPDVFMVDRGPSVGIGDLTAGATPAAISVSGWGRFSGEAVSNHDSPSDASPGGGPAGAELIGARLAYRPEEANLLARLEVDRLPPTPRPPSAAQARIASLPSVVYGMDLDADNVRYQLRAARGVASRWATAWTFTLLRCNPACAETATLAGSIGVTGDHVNIAVPLSALGIGSGGDVTGARAFVAFGDATVDPTATLDDVRLPSLVVAPPSVTLGIAPAGSGEDDVSFATTADLAGGRFTAAVGGASLAPGTYDLWARACVGARCGARSTRVEIG